MKLENIYFLQSNSFLFEEDLYVRTHGNPREADEHVLADHHLLDQLAVTELHHLRVVEGGGDLAACGHGSIRTGAQNPPGNRK